MNFENSRPDQTAPPSTKMSHLSNPLATAAQLYQQTSAHALPIELQDSIRFYTARLTQAAGILLRLPQEITAQANVLLFRYWLIDDLLQHEYSVYPLFQHQIPKLTTHRTSQQQSSTSQPKSPPLPAHYAA
jgi:hypothetical protein